MGDKSKKLVKVDNWGMFFLQRLQQHYHRNEFCDCTLQFGNNQQVKAHRLVLDVCTDYFQLLEKQGLVQGGCIYMPNEMSSDVVIPIINFMYTGRLEFPSEVQSRLYTTAQNMKMTVLTKLLDAQTLPPVPSKSLPNAKSQSLPVGRSPLKSTESPGANAQPRGIRRTEATLPQMLPGRKLPIWKRRSIPTPVPAETVEFDQPTKIFPTAPVDNTPRPTRFDWPDEEEEGTSSLTNTFEDISYESKPLLQPRDQIVKLAPAAPVLPPPRPRQTVSFEDVLRSTTKRPNTQPIQHDLAKKAKPVDLQEVKEYVEEAQLRKNLLVNEDSDEDVDGDLDSIDTEETFPVPHKSILKATDVPTPPSSKRVRFSMDLCSSDQDGKENTATPSHALPTRVEDPSATNVTNHAKIITEVLKKYPHLVANNKNIRLKIMQRGVTPSAAPPPDGKSKSKVSYVVLKSDVKAAKNEGVVVSSINQRVQSGAENVTGPWLCHTCGTNENPVNFESYYLYRRHLQEVHMEKIDARICEHCGHRASKRNLLLYHLYTKHGILPPRNCQFPKCDQCNYVALSESLLIKHRHNHINNREFVCRVCNATFKSNGALQGHMQTNLHSDASKRLYECPYCQKPFVRNINLKAHIRSTHRDVRGAEDLVSGEADELETEEGQVMEVPVMNMVAQSGMTVLASNPASLEPSSEAEALNNVASGIAASLGLTDQQTVILLDENQDFIIHTGDVISDQYIQDGVVQEVQEYIVPEIIGDEQQLLQQQQQQQQLQQQSEQHQRDQQIQTAEVGVETEQQYTEGPPISSTEEVLMVLTDHCYAEGDSGALISKQETTDGKALEAVQEYYGPKDHIEQVLASFEEDDPTPAVTETQVSEIIHEPNLIAPSEVKHTLESNSPLNVNMKTYSPVKKPPLPLNKPPSPKSAPAMSHLLDEWDEESSQEGSVSEEKLPAPQALPTRDEILPTRGDILPTRGEIPEEFLSRVMITKHVTLPASSEVRLTTYIEPAPQVCSTDSQLQTTPTTVGATTYETLEIVPNSSFIDQVGSEQITLVAQGAPFVIVSSDESSRTFFQQSKEDSSYIQETGPLEIEVPEHNQPLLPQSEHQLAPEVTDEGSTVAIENHQSTSQFEDSDQERTIEENDTQNKLLNSESGLLETHSLTDQNDDSKNVVLNEDVSSELLSDNVAATNVPSEVE